MSTIKSTISLILTSNSVTGELIYMCHIHNFNIPERKTIVLAFKEYDAMRKMQGDGDIMRFTREFPTLREEKSTEYIDLPSGKHIIY